MSKFKDYISEGFKRIIRFLNLESWRDSYTKERTVELNESQKRLIIKWLVEILPTLDDWKNIILSGKEYALSEAGEETLSSIVEKLESKKEKLIFTEYELGFMIYWLNKVRRGLNEDFTNAEYILLLQIFEEFRNQLEDSEMKGVIEKIIEKTRC